MIVDEALAVRDAAGHASARPLARLLQELDGALRLPGRQFEKGKKSIALGLLLQDTSRTLTDSEADAIVARVIEQLTLKLNATIRDK